MTPFSICPLTDLTAGVSLRLAGLSGTKVGALRLCYFGDS